MEKVKLLNLLALASHMKDNGAHAFDFKTVFQPGMF
jgi:hypothetical protein